MVLTLFAAVGGAVFAEEGCGESETLSVVLTEEEKAWIQDHPVIRLGIDSEFAPFEYIDEKGCYCGISSDYIKLLNERLGLNMQRVPNLTWEEVVEGARLGEVDVLPSVGLTEGRKQFLLYSTLYIEFQRVIITRADELFITGLDDIRGMKVVVQADSSHEGFLRDETEVKAVSHKTLRESLLAVSGGGADAFLGNLASATYWIRKLSLTNLKIAAPVSSRVDSLHFAVRKDWPELVGILDKGLASISPETRDAIQRDWVVAGCVSGIAPKTVFLLLIAVFGVVLLVVAGITVWNRVLRREVRRKTGALREGVDLLAEAQRIAHVGNWSLDIATGSVKWSDEIYRILSLDVGSPILSREFFMDAVHPDDRHMVDLAYAHWEDYRTSYELEHRLLLKDGTVKYVCDRYEVEHDEKGNPIRLVGTVQDVTDHVLAVEQLHASEESLAITLNSIGDAVISIDIEKRIVQMNPVAEALMGWTLAEALGHSLDEVFNIVNSETREKVEAPVEKVLRDGIIAGLTNHTSLIARDGAEHHIADSAAPVRNAEGQVVGVVLVFRDVTEFYEKEEALRQSELKYRTFFENSTDAMFILENNRNIDCNDAAIALFGHDGREKIIGAHPSELSPEFQPDGRSSLDKANEYMQLSEAQGSHRFEWVHQRKDGTPFPTEIFLTAIATVQGMQLHVVLRDMTERKRAEKELKDSEERFRGMFENMSSGVAVYEAVDDGADFVFLDFNPGGERIEKISRKDVVGKRLLKVFPAAGEVGIVEVLQRVWRTGEPECFPVIFKKDGRLEGWRENHIYRLDSGEVVAVYDDLTAQKQAEEERGKAHAFLQTVIDGLPEELMVINRDYTISMANRKAREVAGDELDFGSSKCHGVLYGSETPCREKETGHRCLLPEIVKTRKPVMAEYVRRNALGGEMVVEVLASPIFNDEGKVVQIIESCRDITERRQAEKEKERLLAAIDQAAECVVITDAEGTIQYVNPAFERITGYAPDEAIGQNPRILKSGEQDDAFYQSMWKVLAEGQTWSGRFVNCKKDGTLYTEEATISPVKDPAGKIVNYVGLKIDITAELIQEERVRQVQKMESIGRLAGGIAHDFNNILQTITGFCGVILVEMDGQSTQRADVVEIQKAARLAGDLTQQLLAFSREHPIQYTVVDLNAVLSGGEKMLRQALDESFQLRFKPESRLKPVRADASQILQMAMNLIVNAKDAMPEGGAITVRTQKMEIAEKDLSGWLNARIGEWICFSVSDTGCGMDEKQMVHLFEPFYTTKPVGKGTGLGLSVVYGIVEEHEGWIHVDSEPGKGSTFKIFLPVHDATGKRDDESMFDGFKGKRILLVEDDPMTRGLTAEILQNMSYTVTLASDVGEAEQLFSEKNGAFNLLFIDVMLPDGNGIELAERLLNQHPGLPVLLFSGTDDPAVAERSNEKGFYFIKKPFNLKKLLNTVEQAMTRCKG